MGRLGAREMDFVARTLESGPGRTVLDVGIGNGRVIDVLLGNPRVEAVYGIDIAQEMVDVCTEKFSGDERVKELRAWDVGQGLCFDVQFDFVSAIRVLKYNQRWDYVLRVVAARLATGGRFLFTMPNRNSLNRYSRYPIATYTTSEKDIRDACAAAGLRVVKVTSFSKIPSRLYLLSSSEEWADFVLGAESLLDRVLGSQSFGRELFVVAKREPGTA